MVNLCEVKLDCWLGWQFEPKPRQFNSNSNSISNSIRKELWTHMCVRMSWCVHENKMCAYATIVIHFRAIHYWTLFPIRFHAALTACFSIFAGRNATSLHSAYSSRIWKCAVCFAKEAHMAMHMMVMALMVMMMMYYYACITHIGKHYWTSVWIWRVWHQKANKTKQRLRFNLKCRSKPTISNTSRNGLNAYTQVITTITTIIKVCM